MNQLERSATSIGANIHEANYAHSKADFTAKLQIALKECYETEYWLELMQKADLLPEGTSFVCQDKRGFYLPQTNQTEGRRALSLCSRLNNS